MRVLFQKPWLLLPATVPLVLFNAYGFVSYIIQCNWGWAAWSSAGVAAGLLSVRGSLRAWRKQGRSWPTPIKVE